MKNIINPYIKSLIKENIVYLITSVVMFFLIIYVFSFNTQKILENNAKIASLESSAQELESKSKLLNSSITAENQKELDNYIAMLNYLIPNTEDFFSIIYTLETLSKKTGFKIVSYDINLTGSSKEKLELGVTGEGNQDYFMNFLKQYNFSGGRFITMDKIDITPNYSGAVKLNLAFYNKIISTSQNDRLMVNDKMFIELASIKEKITFSVKNGEEDQIDTTYPKKLNPF